MSSAGGIYDPVADTWKALPLAAPNEPPTRYSYGLLWAGQGVQRVLLVGGYTVPHGSFGDVGKLDPATGLWTYVPDDGLFSGRQFSAVWTGAKVMVWGGLESPGQFLNDGAAFDPVGETWVGLPASANDPGYRYDHTAVWTGTEMIVWGGTRSYAPIAEGRIFSPVTGTWHAMADSWGPAPRANHAAFWTGTRMLIFGGTDADGVARLDGSLYAVETNTWTGIAKAPLADRAGYSVVWSGAELIVWGGCDPTSKVCYDDGASYAPGTNEWRDVPSGGPGPRRGHAAVWAGGQMIVWGGFDAEQNPLRDGGRFVPPA
jgi:hypothetical protein